MWSAGVVPQTRLTLLDPAGIPLAQGLPVNPGLFRDVADRTTRVDPLTQATPPFRGQRSVTVAHQRAILLGVMF